MKKSLISALTAAVMIILSGCFAFSASAGTLTEPVLLDAEAIGKLDGAFGFRAENTDRIRSLNSFTAALYMEEIYPAESIEKLQAGDMIVINGRVFTVEQVIVHEPAREYEIYTAEPFDGYIAFARLEGTDAYRCTVNDWVPMARVGEAEIALPLHAGFTYYEISPGEEPEQESAEEFIRELTDDGRTAAFNPYNTTAFFSDGVLLSVQETDYPYGPYGDMDDDSFTGNMTDWAD